MHNRNVNKKTLNIKKEAKGRKKNPNKDDKIIKVPITDTCEKLDEHNTQLKNVREKYNKYLKSKKETQR